MSLSPIVQFTEDSAALEKSLRLVQGLCTITAGLEYLVPNAQPWMTARAQLALGRRYFRLFKWHPCWSNALASIQRDQNPVKTLLEVIKWTLLGTYYFLEALTITNAMGVTHYAWAPVVQLESHRCWFCSLAASILLSLYELLIAPTMLSEPASKADKSSQKADVSGKKQASDDVNRASNNIYEKLAIDSFDLVIPGSTLGWIPAGLIVMGLSLTVSSFLGGRQMWRKIQAKAI